MPQMPLVSRDDSREDADQPSSIQGRAAADLKFIRRAMERSATFTAVPGLGGTAMGGIGLMAAGIAAVQPSAERRVITWLTAAAIALVVGLVTMRRKARRAGIAWGGASTRSFFLSLAAPLVAGAALTAGLWFQGVWGLMPSAWLLLYGAGVLTGGAFSVAPMRVLGLSFMALGLASLVTPPSWGNVWLGIGFGALQVGFGWHIARHHGG